MSDAQVPAVERRARAAPPLKGVAQAKLLDEFLFSVDNAESRALREIRMGSLCGAYWFSGG